MNDIKYIPFDKLYQDVVSAGSSVEHDLVVLQESHRAALIRKKEKEWNAVNEAPYEGDWDEIIPPAVVDKEALAKGIVNAKREAFKSFVDANGLKQKGRWILPQTAAYVAKIPLEFNEVGKVNTRAYLLQFGVDDWHKGLYLYLTTPLRGEIVRSQVDPEGLPYNGLVPLLLMPHKKFNGVPYSKWELTKHLFDSTMFEALTFQGDMPTDVDKILEDRRRGLEFQSGKDRGTMRKASSAHQLYGIKGTIFEGMPRYCQVMSAQIWGAHPINRHEFMILNWKDWDDIPKPLIEAEVLPVKNTSKSVEDDRMPWDD